GNMGTFLSYTAFNNTASPGPQGQPAGSYMPSRIESNTNPVGSESRISNSNRTSGSALPSTEGAQEGTRGIANQRDSSRLG
ncbi:Type IV secretion system protein virB6, partial [Xanthomonas dyei]